MAAVPLYCVCRQPYDVNRFMIECDVCKDWFHGSCVQVEEHQAADIDVYHCPNCDVHHGPSLMKKRNNWHRHDYTEPDDGTWPVQAGTSVFVQELRARTFRSVDEIIVKLQGNQVTQKYLEKHGFQYPIMVPKLDGLGLKLPDPSFSVRDVEQYVGGEKIIDVIDVARQADSKIKLAEFVKYFDSHQRSKVLNVISLEFSDTRMAELVEVPDVAQKMSWVENYWPDDSFFPKPFVQKYCLMGVKDSYTDFHIDFGGTSVWYHVLWGEKIFYLIKPTAENLALYEQWSSSPNQSEVFFGEKVDECYKCVVQQGTTLLIPTGWIHAVLTSQDCMAFGGNFLHNLNIAMQLRCYEIERRLKTPDLFKFPYFEAICWYVAKNLLEMLKELREDSCQPPAYLTEGVKALIVALKSWLKREVSEPTSEIPDNIRPNHLIKELTKQVRHQEEELGGGTCKPTKTQGNGSCPVTRSTSERGSRARRIARRLRDHRASKGPSNLDILELHTQEVLRRLEMASFELDSRVNGRFNKASTASMHSGEKGLDNYVCLVLCNGRIVRVERKRHTEKCLSVSQNTGQEDMQKGGAKMVVGESGCDPNGVVREEERSGSFCVFLESVKSELRSDTLRNSVTDSKSICITQRQHSSGEYSGSSEEEEESMSDSSRSTTQGCSGGERDLHQAKLGVLQPDELRERERPTSPSTEEAIQGMLTMAGLLCPECPDRGTVLQEPWWSGAAGCTLDCGAEETASETESQGECDSNTLLIHQDEMRLQKHISKGCRAHLSEQIQENKNFMDCGSRDPWSNRSSLLLQDTQFQYTDTLVTPPLHPSKRPAANPPPITNQATKGKRPKKGMSTTKQRLNKILKLNRESRFLV